MPLWETSETRAVSDQITTVGTLKFWESLLYPDQKPGEHMIDASSREALVRSTLKTLNQPNDAGAYVRVSGPDSEAIELAPGYESGEWWNILHFELQYYTPERGWWYVNITFEIEGGQVSSPYLEVCGKRGPLPERFRKAFEQAEIEIPAI